MYLSDKQFSELTLFQFHQRSANILKENYPKNVPADPDLLRLIFNRDIEAQNEGFKSELARFRYIHTAFVLGDNFPDDHEVMMKILERKDLTPNDRSYYIEETMLSMFKILYK